MDITDFDSLAKVVGAWTSRRGALSLLAAFGLGSLGPREAEARKSGKCKPACAECATCDKGKCRKNNQGRKVCKKGKCKPKAFGTPCTLPGGGICQDGICACPGGLTNCNGSCGNLLTDEANCGTCGVGCTATQVCQEGSCFTKSTCAAAIPSLCLPPGPVGCGPSCECGTSTEGNIVCMELGAFFCMSATCATSADCPPGQACVDAGGCCLPTLPAGSLRCLPPCSAPSA